MSDTVKLASKLAADFEMNGLDGIVDELNADPKTPRIGLVVFDVQGYHETPDGVKTPTVRIRRFEPAGTKGEVFDRLQKDFLTLNAKRTGREPIPFDVVEVVHSSSSTLDEPQAD